MEIQVKERKKIIEEWKADGNRIAAVFPIHYPRALFRAFDLLPVEVWGPPNVDVSLGAAHLQPYVCSIVRNALSFVISGGLDVVDLIVVPHACDSLQGLGSLLLDFIDSKKPVLPLYIPKGDRADDVEFLKHEIEKMFQILRKITGKNPDGEILEKYITLEEKADEITRELFEKRHKLPIGNYDFYKVIRSREYLPSERFIETATPMLQGIHNPQDGIPLIISGIVPEPFNVLRKFDEMGILVVGDDTACCGRRIYPKGKSKDPFERMAERIVYGPPDPMRGSSLEKRFQHILSIAEIAGVRAVMFYLVKFCEPELFYIPILREKLKECGIQTLLIEVDVGEPVSNQMVGRISAFMEMIQRCSPR